MLLVSGRPALGMLALTCSLLVSACSEENAYVPPPPPKVDVAVPVKQGVTPYLEAVGTTAAVNSTTLVARVPGFVQTIDYEDGDEVESGSRLFLIEPAPYQLALEQAKAAQESADASARQSAAELERQKDLLSQKVVSQSAADQAAAAAAIDVAKQKQAAADVKQAELNLSYTEVKAPFPGIVTARQVSTGELVGAGGTTALATIVQLAPVYVNFSISEQDVLRIRAAMERRGLSAQDLKTIPVEVGLQGETGYPHRGKLDYAAPGITASTGTLAVRAVLPNEGRALLPGYFVRLRVPLGEEPDMLLVPDRAIGSDQGGRYVLVAAGDDTVEQRPVEIGQRVGALRVIVKGVAEDDRVLVSGLMAAVPGQKIEPRLTVLDAVDSGDKTQ